MNWTKVTKVLAAVGSATPIGKILYVAGAVCLVKGAYELIKAAKEEGYRDAILGEDEDEEESPKTLSSIIKAAKKKVDYIFDRYGEGLNWILFGWDCLLWMDVFDVAVLSNKLDEASRIANHNYDVAIRERTQKKNLVSAICKFSRKLSNECNEQYNLADGMDHSKMGYKFVLQKAKVLDRACDWLDDCIAKPMIAAGAKKR